MDLYYNFLYRLFIS